MSDRRRHPQQRNGRPGGAGRGRILNPSSMLPLRAAVASLKRQRDEEEAVGGAGRGLRLPSAVGDASRSASRSKRGRSSDDDTSRRHCPGGRRGERGEGQERGEGSRWEEKVRTSLDRKSRLYDQMLAGGAGGASSRSSKDDDDILVDFGQKRREAGRDDDYEYDRSGRSRDPGAGDRPTLVPLTDEFGRTVMVPEDSSRYRQYLAEEARKARTEEIWRARRLVEEGAGGTDVVGHHAHWGGDRSQQQPSEGVNGSYSEEREEDRRAPEGSKLCPSKFDENEDEPKVKMSRRDKKAARLELLREKKEAREAKGL